MKNNKWYFDRKKLVTARKIFNLTQQDVADKLGITKQMYQQWESGARTPNIHSLIKICEVLAVKPHIFFSNDDIQSESYYPMSR